MGAFSELNMELEYGDDKEKIVAAFQVEQAVCDPPRAGEGQQIHFEDDACQQAEADAAPREMEKLMQTGEPPVAGEIPDGQCGPQEGEDPKEDEARKAHEESEAKRRAEWEARRAAKKAAEEEQLRKVAAMSEEELLAASAARINTETEWLTRRNMKEYVAEYIQTLCLDDLEFARLTMHPRKSFMHCIWHINRKAREYLEQEMKDNGMERPYGVDGMYGGDVPDDLVYKWAEDYYRTDAEEDKEPEEEFVPKPYRGPVSTGSRKKRQPKKKAAEQKEKKQTIGDEPKKEPEDENQISLGAFLEGIDQAS